LSPQYTNLYGLLARIKPKGDPLSPYVLPRLCVYLVLTEARGTGAVQIKIVLEETGQTVFQTNPRSFKFGNDPLAIHPFPPQVSNCRFPRAGNYAVQFWYNGVKAAERLLRLE
jgi:hypothetical protein